MWSRELKEFCSPLNDLNKLKREWETTFDAFLMQMDQNRLDLFGGYSATWRMVGNHIVMATQDHDGAPELMVWSKKEVKEWVKQVIEALTKMPEQDRIDCWFDFFCEFWPEC